MFKLLVVVKASMADGAGMTSQVLSFDREDDARAAEAQIKCTHEKSRKGTVWGNNYEVTRLW